MKEGTLSVMWIVFFLDLRSARCRAALSFASASFFFYDIYASCVVFSIQRLLQEFLQEDFSLQEKCIIRGTVPVVCLFKKSYTSFHLLVTGRRRTICFVARKLSFLFLMRGMVGAESDLSNDNAY